MPVDEIKTSLRQQSPMAVGKYEEFLGMCLAERQWLKVGPTDHYRHEEALMSTNRIAT